MLKVDEMMPLKFLPEGTYPKWIERVEAELARVMLPTVKLKEGLKLTPKRLGGLLGHECAYAVMLRDFIYQSVPNASPTETESELAKSQESFPVVKSFDEWYSAMRRLAKRSLCSSVDQTFEDMSDFLAAFSAAFARKPEKYKSGDIGSTNFEIYIFLVMYWRQIETLNSVAELHQLLRKMMGEHRTGDLKRIEKICQRIALHFRKPGRPKASQ